MSIHPVETYLTHLREIRDTGGGTAEESYYGPLEALFNEAGGRLKPRVRAVQQLRNRGSGEPDFGFYTADQFQGRDDAPTPGLNPERGAAEAKPWTDDAFAVAESDQVARYLRGYRLVLVTNYREFILKGWDDAGRPIQLESFRLAETPAAFLDQLAHPHRAAEQHGERLLDFLRRVLLYRAPLTDPQDLAFFLASYAREARARIEAATDLRALATLKGALEAALGMRFEGERGEHFFRATLVQTLFYGVFSSWVLWCRDMPDGPDGRFDWHKAVWTLHVPMIRDLFEQIATPSRLKPLGIDQTLDWAGAALNRVNRPAFFSRFEEDHAVQYFYEPFLRAYDPELRKELGVWYTPPEIVRYQVERVDRVLRDELGLADGLADERVVVLDPCCGTGAYLVETLRRIYATLDEQGAGALLAQRLKRAAAGRVFGFELLPAPFVVAHLQLGLLLRGLGAPLGDDERAGVYLTNSLTGWEPPAADRAHLPFPELEAERDAAERVKQQKHILVILGNPPYNAFAGVSPEEEGALVEPYKAGLNKPVEQGGWGIKKFNLDDLYVRFFRVAERRIMLSGQGVICYISNFSYLGDPSFVVMRQRLLGEFDRLWFDCLNGDSRETGKLTPDGLPDPSVFSTAQNREGIRVGTAIGLFVRRRQREEPPVVRFRHFWGAAKRADLLASLDAPDFDAAYQTAAPAPVNRYSFRPSDVGDAYLTWPRIPDLAKSHFNGPVERRGFALISMDREPLVHRMRNYFDETVSDEAVRAIYPSLMMTGNRIVGPEARRKVRSTFTFNENRIVPYPFKPFDVRWCYLDNLRPLFSEPSPELLEHRYVPDNAFLITRDTADKSTEGSPFFFSPVVCDYDSISGHARHFPMRLLQKAKSPKKDGMASFFDNDEPTVTANLSPAARAYLSALGLPDPDADAETAALIWRHALAVGYSPAYLRDNADGIRQDWPRVPLPATAAALRASAALGRRVANLLDTERPVPGVTTGRIRPDLRGLAEIRRAGGGQLDPARGHLDLTAGWGHAGKEGVTMPGRGKVMSSDERGVTNPRHSSLVTRRSSLDIYLNDDAYWADVPADVWQYTIGGYQVIKKWLSYREKGLLGRGLTLDEVETVTQMARRLAALVALEPELDANYHQVAAEVWAWPRG